MAESSKGTPLEEMTHEEHVAYLEDEAQKQADYNAAQYAKVEEAYKSASTPGTAGPTDKTNDELRAENEKAVDAELATVGAAPTPAKKPASPPAPPAAHKSS